MMTLLSVLRDRWHHGGKGEIDCIVHRLGPACTWCIPEARAWALENVDTRFQLCPDASGDPHAAKSQPKNVDTSPGGPGWPPQVKVKNVDTRDAPQCGAGWPVARRAGIKGARGVPMRQPMKNAQTLTAADKWSAPDVHAM